MTATFDPDRELILKARRVRTPEGARFFNLPIGALITNKAVREARQKYGTGRVWNAMDKEAGFETVPLHGVAPPSVLNVPRDNGKPVSKAKGPVDGDGDGWVYDGTPRKRPATPAERAAGARLRAKKAARDPKKQPPAKAAKKAANAKDPIEQRKQRFERAIKAVKNKQDEKRVRDLIRQDFVLDKKARAELSGRLDEHVGRKPAAKKVAAPRAAAKPKDHGELKGADGKPILPPKPKAAAGKKAMAARKRAEGAAAKPGPVTRAHQEMRDAVLDITHPKRDVASVGAARREAAGAPRGKIREAAAKTPEVDLRSDDRAKAIADRLKARIDAIKTTGELDRFRANILPDEKAIMRANSGLLRGVNDHFKAKKRELEGKQTTEHGPKTRAWNRLWNRDLNRATTNRMLDRLEKQVESLHRQGRISDNERQRLLNAVERKRMEVGLGRHRRPQRLSQRLSRARRNVGGRHRSDKAPSGEAPRTPLSPEQTPLEGVQEQVARFNEFGDQIGQAARANDKDALLRAQNALDKDNILNDHRKGLLNAEINEQVKRIDAEKIDSEKVGPMSDPAQEDVRQGRLRAYDDWVERIDGMADPGLKEAAMKQFLDAVAADDDIKPEDMMALIDQVSAMAKGKSPKRVGDRGGTIEPKKPAGAARARAREAGFDPQKGNAGYQAHRKSFEDAVDINEVLHAIQKASMDNTLSEDEINDLLDNVARAAERRIKQMEKRREGDPVTSGKDATPDAYAAQREHFGKGGSIGDAPPVGLWNYVRSEPNRFSVQVNGKKGISPNYWVTDHETGERWMFKRATIPDDVMKEQVAARIMKGAGFKMPDTKFASDPEDMNGAPGFMAQRHYAEQLEEGREILNNRNLFQQGGYAALVPKLKKGTDRKALARMVIFDYLIDNQVDRHGQNIMFVEDKNGNVNAGIIDQGLAFGGWAGLKRNKSFGEFFAHYRAREWEAPRMIAEIAGSRATLKRHLEEQIKGFGAVDLRELRELIQQGQEADHQKYGNWLDEFQYRLQWLQDDRNLNRVVDMIAQYGGI